MSRLRRLVLPDRFFFVTCRLSEGRRPLAEAEFAVLASVIDARRRKYRFLLTAWVLLPDHWHAIISPRHPVTISRVMEAVKVGSTLRINGARGENGLLWQGRFFDRALRIVKEYHEKVGYIHQNPVRADLVTRAEDWAWSSVHEYTGTVRAAATPHPILRIDRVLLPADSAARL
ncbi:MAG TPA: transposase [Terriglobia bacterium]|nr:transposase [Terriglobia bacterium]